MPDSSPRMKRRALLAAVLVVGLAGCDIGPATRTRADAALLTPQDLARAQAAEGAQAAPAPGATGACAQVEGIVAQLRVIAADRLRFSGTGEMTLDETGWRRLPGPQRTLLLRTLATQNRCKTGAAKGIGIIRAARGGRIIDRYSE